MSGRTFLVLDTALGAISYRFGALTRADLAHHLADLGLTQDCAVLAAGHAWNGAIAAAEGVGFVVLPGDHTVAFFDLLEEPR